MNSKEKSEHDASKVAKFLTKDPVEIEKKVNEPIRNVLQRYSHISEEKVVEHVLELVCIDEYLIPAFNGLRSIAVKGLV